MVKKVVFAALFITACQPDLGPSSSFVDRLRLLAVKMEPAEAAPGSTVTYTALTTDTANLTWSFCIAPKPLDENNTVASACFFDGNALQPLGSGIIPINACALFGSSPPPQDPSLPPLRPRDPDVTGGYYQPVRVDDGIETTFALQRITCDLANATIDQTILYRMTYQPNTNPKLNGVSAIVGNTAVAFDHIPAHGSVTLRADWTPASAETFPVYDLQSQSLVNQRESLRVSWYTTAGTLLLDRSGRGSDEMESFAENTWSTGDAGPAHLWAVLRDNRGGVAWLDYPMMVTE